MPLFFPLGSASSLQPGVKSTLLFLWHLAWKCRIRLPVLLTVTLLVMDARMRIEINMDVEEMEEDEALAEEEEEVSEGDDFSDDSDDMWPLETTTSDEDQLLR